MFRKELLERFIRYVKTDTMSNAHVARTKHPSTEGQWDLLRMLEKELRDMGLEDVELDSCGYLLARIPANMPDVPCIGFSAHVDTASDVMGNGVKPRVIESYDGGDIVLKSGLVIKAAENPELAPYKGTTLVVSDGTTLLGSDDKSGVAEIMTAVHRLVENPQIKHGEIEILLSPDEETGFGMDFFDASRLHSTVLYTMDGGTRYEISSECFNAASVEVRFKGVPYHLGDARGRMVNALTMLCHYVSSLPQAESPEATDGRQGYYCAHEAEGNVEKAKLNLLLRDFDYDALKERIRVLEKLASSTEALFSGGKVEFSSEISYLNMGESARSNPKALQAVWDAGRALGQPLEDRVIRGGTDGARIAAARGIACPNIYAGGHNMHSCCEWAALEAMNDAALLLLEIVNQWTK